ncbi:MAG: phosphate-starvation-inducible PsiE family protein [Deltaproteobacteria bacterium]|nr:phosphate-starvation-inducible PsiE family protein [Deltaproteobacteria bacterium]
MKKDAVYWAERAERGIYWAVGALLIVVAVIFLVFFIINGFPLYFKGEFATATIKLFDQALLTLMIAQVVYTTVAFLKVGVLQVEPILVVGIIASVRRVLVMTAVVSGTAGNVGATLNFRQNMVEIGLLSLTVLILAIAIYLVRKSKSFLSSDEKLREK